MSATRSGDTGHQTRRGGGPVGKHMAIGLVVREFELHDVARMRARGLEGSLDVVARIGRLETGREKSTVDRGVESTGSLQS